ncbi:hypothetical protein ABH920_005001 [Catenulispora sp. EB89]
MVRTDPAAVLLRGLFDLTAGFGRGVGGGEGTAVEVRLAEDLRLGVEDGQDLLAWVSGRVDGAFQPAGGAFVPRGQVGAHERLLAAEGVVERAFGDTGVFEDLPERTGPLRQPQTAETIRGLRLWATNEYEHDGLRVSSGRVLDRLLRMVRGQI